MNVSSVPSHLWITSDWFRTQQCNLKGKKTSLKYLDLHFLQRFLWKRATVRRQGKQILIKSSWARCSPRPLFVLSNLYLLKNPWIRFFFLGWATQRLEILFSYLNINNSFAISKPVKVREIHLITITNYPKTKTCAILKEFPEPNI